MVLFESANLVRCYQCGFHSHYRLHSLQHCKHRLLVSYYGACLCLVIGSVLHLIMRELKACVVTQNVHSRHDS